MNTGLSNLFFYLAIIHFLAGNSIEAHNYYSINSCEVMKDSFW